MQHFKKQFKISIKPSTFMLFKSGQFKSKVYFKSYLVRDSEDQQIIKDRTPYISDIDVRSLIYHQHERYIDFIKNNRDEFISIENFDYGVFSIIKLTAVLSIIGGGLGAWATESFDGFIIFMSFSPVIGVCFIPQLFFERRKIQQYINYRNLSSDDFLKAVKDASAKK